jgi:hypothetical protein
MPENEPVLSWLLEDDNPGVRIRALTGLCEYPADHHTVTGARRLAIQALSAASDLDRSERAGIDMQSDRPCRIRFDP